MPVEFRRSCLALATVAMVGWAPPWVALRAQDPDFELQRGRELAGVLCAPCHMNPGQGEKQGQSGIPSFAAIANRPRQTADGVVAWLKSRPPMMPKHDLTEDEIYRLAIFIMSLRNDD